MKRSDGRVPCNQNTPELKCLSEASESIDRARRNTLSDLLVRTRRRHPKKLALVYGEKRLTYSELDDVVSQTARAFLEDGIVRGSHVAVMSKNSLDFVVVTFALARIGAVMVPLNYMLTVNDLAFIVRHAEVNVVVAALAYAESLDAAVELSGVQVFRRYLMDESLSVGSSERLDDWISLSNRRHGLSTSEVEVTVHDNDVAHVLYTSGTESRPKGVMLTHANLIAEYVSCIVAGNMSDRDVVLHALPLYHSAQLHCFLGPSIYLGSTGIIIPSAGVELILEAVERERVTQLFCPPTVWIALLRHSGFTTRNVTSLEKCYYGAAIMPREVLKELTQRLPRARFYNFYGQTEVAPLAAALQPEDQLQKLGSAGKPTLNVETKIVDEAGREVAPNTVGEIVHRTAHAMKGYLNEPEKTTEVFGGGWFHSGDLGFMDEEGYLTVVDRKKDMIKTGGVNVSSREVEEAIYELSGVSEVAVIGIPDDYWIEAVTAVVVVKDGAQLTEEDILVYCREHLSTFKAPKRVVIRDCLPKNPSGKILKRELRDEFSKGHVEA